jgi:hypothetical protein
MEPASSIIEQCGGVDSVAAVCNRNRTNVHRWKYAKEKGGTDGIIPADCQIILMRASAANGWGLKPEDFFPADLIGARADEA